MKDERRKTKDICRRRGGFTLIEILVVIAIIIILVGIVIAVGVAVRTNAQRTQTKITLRAMAALLDSYKQDVGSYPTTAASPDPSALSTLVRNAMQMPQFQRALASLPPSALQNNQSTGGSYVVYDGFGNAIQMITTGSRAPYFQSNGPDGIPNNSDDMYSYDP